MRKKLKASLDAMILYYMTLYIYIHTYHIALYYNIYIVDGYIEYLVNSVA